MRQETYLRAVDIDPGPDDLSLRESWTDRPAWGEFVIQDTVVALRFQAVEELPVLTEVRIFPWDRDEDRLLGEWSGDPHLVPAGGISPVFIKNLALGSLRDQALAALANPNDPAWPGDADEKLGAWFEVTGRASIARHRMSEPEKRGGRRPTVSEVELAQVAFHYQTAVRKGIRIHRYIEQKMPDLTGLVSNRIYRAREKGLLTGGGGGRGLKGGVMSKQAEKILASHDLLDHLRQEQTE